MKRKMKYIWITVIRTTRCEKKHSERWFIMVPKPNVLCFHYFIFPAMRYNLGRDCFCYICCISCKEKLTITALYFVFPFSFFHRLVITSNGRCSRCTNINTRYRRAVASKTILKSAPCECLCSVGMFFIFIHLMTLIHGTGILSVLDYDQYHYFRVTSIAIITVSIIISAYQFPTSPADSGPRSNGGEI